MSGAPDSYPAFFTFYGVYMKQKNKQALDFTEGNIGGPMVRFALPVLLAMFLQVTYGAVDVLVVGLFGTPADVSAVSTGSQILQTLTLLIVGLSVGTTVLLGRKLGEKRFRAAGKVVGAPVALQDLLVSISFLVVLAIVNGMGVIASAGVGVAEKLCGFIMLVPSAYMQYMAVFTAQNMGARKPQRARRALKYCMWSSLAVGIPMGAICFFYGSIPAGWFAADAAVVDAVAQYLRAYALDCVIVSFLFCFIGYFNGREKTAFVLFQGLTGAFFVGIPVSYVMSITPGATLFDIGLASPCATVVQLVLCVLFLAHLRKRRKAGLELAPAS